MGGAEIDKQASEADPLRRPTLMEMQLAESKKTVRGLKDMPCRKAMSGACTLAMSSKIAFEGRR